MLVSADDYDFVSRWKWKRHRQGYACRTTYHKDTKTFPLLLMHRVIAERAFGEIPKGLVVDHINRVKLDNRRDNLRVVTQGENNLNGGGRPPRVYPDEKVCEWCGKTYTPSPRKRKRQKTCGRECAYLLRGKNISAAKRA